jgi:hypothetical protein
LTDRLLQVLEVVLVWGVNHTDEAYLLLIRGTVVNALSFIVAPMAAKIVSPGLASRKWQ